MRLVKIGKIYRHFKGNTYKVLHIGYSCDDLRKLVIYQDIEDDKKVWVRNYDEFNSYVDKNKYPDVTQEYRFEEL